MRPAWSTCTLHRRLINAFSEPARKNILMHIIKMQKLNLPKWVSKKKTTLDMSFRTPNPIFLLPSNIVSQFSCPLTLLPVNDQWPVYQLSFLPDGASRRLWECLPYLCLPRTCLYSMGHSQSPLLTVRNVHFPSIWIDRSSSTYSSFLGN